MYYSDFSYLFDLLGWSVALGGLLQLALYVAESLGLYAMARNTGVHNPWFPRSFTTSASLPPRGRSPRRTTTCSAGPSRGTI